MYITWVWKQITEHISQMLNYFSNQATWVTPNSKAERLSQPMACAELYSRVRKTPATFTVMKLALRVDPSFIDITCHSSLEITSGQTRLKLILQFYICLLWSQTVPQTKNKLYFSFCVLWKMSSPSYCEIISSHTGSDTHLTNSLPAASTVL